MICLTNSCWWNRHDSGLPDRLRHQHGDYGAVVALDHAARARQRAPPADRLKEPSRQPSRAGAGPALMRAASEEHARLAASLLARFQLRQRVEHLLETADLKWGAVGLIHRSGAAALGASAAVLIATRNSMPLLTLLGAALGARAKLMGGSQSASTPFINSRSSFRTAWSSSPVRCGRPCRLRGPRNGAQGVQRASGGRIQIRAFRGTESGATSRNRATQDGAPHASFEPYRFSCPRYSCKSARAAIWRNCSISSRRSSGDHLNCAREFAPLAPRVIEGFGVRSRRR